MQDMPARTRKSIFKKQKLELLAMGTAENGENRHITSMPDKMDIEGCLIVADAQNCQPKTVDGPPPLGGSHFRSID